MASKLKDVIEGFNAYLDGLAEEDKVEYLFSLTLFDTQVAYRHVAIPLAKVRKLDAKSFARRKHRPERCHWDYRPQIDADRPRVDKVVTVIMTDGEENSSREWTPRRRQGAHQPERKRRHWTFVFLGASPEAWDQGRAYGIPAANVAQYDVNHYRDMFACTARGRTSWRSSAAPRATNLFASILKTYLVEGGPLQASKELKIG